MTLTKEQLIAGWNEVMKGKISPLWGCAQCGKATDKPTIHSEKGYEFVLCPKCKETANGTSTKETETPQG